MEQGKEKERAVPFYACEHGVPGGCAKDLVQRAVQRLRDNINRRETNMDLEAIKAVLVEMAAQKDRADTFERRVVKAELESEELARRIGDQSGRLATVAIERDGYSKVINELTKQIQERDALLAKAREEKAGVETELSNALAALEAVRKDMHHYQDRCIAYQIKERG